MHAPEPEFALLHPCGLRIQKELRELSVKGLAGVEAEEMGNGYVWYQLPEAEIAGQTVASRLCFFKGTLELLSVAVVDSELYGGSWSDWTEEKEKARMVATGRWLSALGCPLGKYSWGTVFAELDPKTGDGSGGVRFAPRWY